ncbi:MAG: hypothetical protein MJ067_02820 [Oscillospiraceae bacterium]|nr:hypothetical protein [Oscillospiraceae bacterium]
MGNRGISSEKGTAARFHLPGLFEFYELYRLFLPIFYEHREYFYEGFEIGSVYGAPADCLWGGGRTGFGGANEGEVFSLLREYGISARLTFSNSLLRPEHLHDKKCNRLLSRLSEEEKENGVIIHSDLLKDYIKNNYPGLYLVSSTTKVLRKEEELLCELSDEAFRYVVPDFRLNKSFDFFSRLDDRRRSKLELLCNECCYFGCESRRACYESVSRKALGEDGGEHICSSPFASEGYVFSRAMENPAFIGPSDIREKYLPLGITEFKIEGRSLGSAIILEFLLYYLTKPEARLKLRELIYLDSALDLF